MAKRESSRRPISVVKHIVMSLTPRDVVYLCHNRFHFRAGCIKAVVEIERTKEVSEVTQMGEEPNRTHGTLATLVLDMISDKCVDRCEVGVGRW